METIDIITLVAQNLAQGAAIDPRSPALNLVEMGKYIEKTPFLSLDEKNAMSGVIENLRLDLPRV